MFCLTLGRGEDKYLISIFLVAIGKVYTLVRMSQPTNDIIRLVQNSAARMLELLIGVSVCTCPDLQFDSVTVSAIRHVDTFVALANGGSYERPNLVTGSSEVAILGRT